MSCNGDGDNNVQNQRTTLTLNVTGLPATVLANILVSGPNNLSETITSTTTLLILLPAAIKLIHKLSLITYFSTHQTLNYKRYQ